MIPNSGLLLHRETAFLLASSVFLGYYGLCTYDLISGGYWSICLHKVYCLLMLLAPLEMRGKSLPNGGFKPYPCLSFALTNTRFVLRELLAV